MTDADQVNLLLALTNPVVLLVLGNPAGGRGVAQQLREHRSQPLRFGQPRLGHVQLPGRGHAAVAGGEHDPGVSWEPCGHGGQAGRDDTTPVLAFVQAVKKQNRLPGSCCLLQHGAQRCPLTFGSAVRRHLDQDGQGDVGTAARIAAGQVTELDEHRDRRV